MADLEDSNLTRVISEAIQTEERNLGFLGDSPAGIEAAFWCAREALRQLNRHLYRGDPMRIVIRRCKRGCCVHIAIFW